ncbi:hypothetical protein Fmac_019338 [Flemingia macrophylla]|uniref:Uncharacterized protein n=1 Tax=Flemingia macrophylla TaxID=520843 RepID=A0ABD1M7Y5_9FABA
MATSLNILEQSQVAPPPGSLPSTTLPLTFFDIPFFHSPLIKRIFFYDFPRPTHHFLQTALPILKHSLSLALQHFFPFAANLLLPPHPLLSHIRYLPGDSLSFTVAESAADFALLTSHSPQHIGNYHPLLPTLPPSRVENDGTRVFPLMAIQVTVLPYSGFAISLTYNHLAADGNSLHHFVKFWASLCKTRGDVARASLEATFSLPSHERERVKDPNGLKLLYFQAFGIRDSKSIEFGRHVPDVFTNNIVRSTLVLSREQVDKLKKWVSLNCVTNDSGALHISSFVVTCSLTWVCMVRSEENEGNGDAVNSDDLCCLVFLADSRDRPEFSLPSTYFGNCVASCLVAMKRSEIVGENGVVEVANAIGRQIMDFKSNALRNAEMLVSEYGEITKRGKSRVIIAGSPKLAVYETDFGWGKPKKSEAAHIEQSTSISLSDSRDQKGGIDVALALETIRMNEFTNIFQEQLNNMIDKF